ncbi:LPS translocon maturation chaperone LptM [Oceanobacter mangrovi]
MKSSSWSPRRLIALLLGAVLSLMLLGTSGCGQKGPLYLPEQPDTEQTS